MKKIIKKVKVTIDDLAVMVAKGFDSVHKEIREVKSELKIEINEVKEKVEKLDNNIQSTRRDMLNMGDKFVSYHTFDELANRVNILEKKSGVKSK